MEKNISKSSEMPEPQIMNYHQTFKLSDMFINDLKKVLGDLPYVEAKKFFDKIDECKGIMHSAQLNEFVNDISHLPYNVVSKLMGVIQNKEKFLKYFMPIDTKPNK